jgi:hypothetical protein
VQSPTKAFMLAVAAVSPHDVWAVGSNEFYFKAFIKRWNGATWQLVPSPKLTDTGITGASDYLDAVAVRSAHDAWAVGMTGGGTLTEHWDGASWKIVLSRDGDLGPTGLAAVTAVSPRDVWAVGDSEQEQGGNGQEKIIEHWNGVKWRLVPSPRLDSAGLSGVAALSPNDVWAVGQGVRPGASSARSLVLHWDGTRWKVVPWAIPFAVLRAE